MLRFHNRMKSNTAQGKRGGNREKREVAFQGSNPSLSANLITRPSGVYAFHHLTPATGCGRAMGTPGGWVLSPRGLAGSGAGTLGVAH
jgi:hypothetical protein